jgi:hypothetical protein
MARTLETRRSVHSSGGKDKLSSISKQGDRCLQPVHRRRCTDGRRPGRDGQFCATTGHPVSLFEQTAKLQRRGPRLRARVPTSASFASGCCNEGTVAEAIAETVDIIRLLCNAQK